MTFDVSHPSSISCSVFLSAKVSMHKYLTFCDPFTLMDYRTSRVWESARCRSTYSIYNNKTIEGGLWYESDDGTFQQAKPEEESRTVFDGYMHSIVRAAPNLLELRFNPTLRPSDFVSPAKL